MTQYHFDPETPSGSFFKAFTKWLCLGLGLWGLYNLGSLILTGHIWVHSGTRAQAHWLLLNATDSPTGLLWGVILALFFVLLGLLGAFLLYEDMLSKKGGSDVVYLDVRYSPGQAPQETVLQPEKRSSKPLNPFTFVCQATLGLPASVIVTEIFQLSQWPSFQGYGPLPGIVRAEFEHGPTPHWVGTRIQVENADGSRHIEEVKAWDGQQLVMELAEFTPPLAWLASHFVETWKFVELDSGHTRVLRHFALYPHSFAGRLLLPAIANLLKRAVQRHLEQMAA